MFSKLFAFAAAGAIGIASQMISNQLEYNEKREEQRINTHLEAYQAVDEEYEELAKIENRSLASQVSSFINSHTVLAGAAKDWNPERLLKGKFSQFKDLGGEGVRLHTRTGDKLMGFYFSVSNFWSQLEKMGVTPKIIDIQLDHPFFKVEEVISIKATINGEEKSFTVSRIPYSEELEETFKNPGKYYEFNNLSHTKLIWEDTLKLVFPTIHSSRKQNILVVDLETYRSFHKTKPEKMTIEKLPSSTTFYKNTFNAIVFENPAEIAKDIFYSNECPRFEGRKTLYKNKLYWGKDLNLFNFMKDFEMDTLPFFKMTERPVKIDSSLNQGGVVVLTMNQVASISSMLPEILTLLMQGVNVFAYDNAGKGLSLGKNNQPAMSEGIRTAGNFLIQRKGFEESKILFKGQCGGAFATSWAATKFDSPIWIDQAPLNLPETVESLASKKLPKDSASIEKFLHYIHSFSLGPQAIKTAISLTLPDYDVAENLSKNKQRHIYTIGVPNDSGTGGDYLVPQQHVAAIKKQMEANEKDLFLEMPGAVHVSPWWDDSNTFDKVKGALKEDKISFNIFENQE